MHPAELGEWYGRHGAALGLYARQWLPADQAEDAVQEVFLRLVTLTETPRAMKPWLFTAVRNAAISRLRRQQRWRRREKRRASEQVAWFCPNVGASLDAEALQGELAALPLEQREIIVMRIWGGLTFQEAAEATGQAVSTLSSRYQAGLCRLRERMGATCETKTIRC